MYGYDTHVEITAGWPAPGQHYKKPSTLRVVHNNHSLVL